MALDLDALRRRVYAGVMAPLVLGGELRPGHAIGARSTLAIGTDGPPADESLHARVQAARLRRARQLAPIDALDAPSAAEWRLGAALHDVLQAANPAFVAPLRRRAAGRLLALAVESIDAVAGPRTVREALSRHTFFARILEIARTDTTVSWWSGTRTFLGVDPPARLRAWPELRRVRIAALPLAILELGPLAVDRSHLVEALAQLLGRTPLTDIATCTRAAPAFAWSEPSVALVGTRAGRTLALRALGRLPTADVDGALGRAVREASVRKQAALYAPLLELLGERALVRAQGALASPQAGLSPPPRSDALFARALGALVASETLKTAPDWPEAQRRALFAVLEPLARSAAAHEAMAAFAPSDAGVPL